MPLYTFIIEHAGATHVRQYRADTPDKAANQMWQSADWSNGNISPDDDRPVKVDGVANTWCLSTTVSGQLALVHFVQTEDIH